ncbi:MAG TPA: hypothetical protein VFV03_07835 [Solirubrobacteraceae bacterium]|nr:hypothetical protein [Solirubrobacteraceae bacterium]
MAAFAVFVAIAAIIAAIALVIQVLAPNQMTLSQLVALQKDHPHDELAEFLDTNEELFGGQGTDLGEFRNRYLCALKRRADAFEAYLDKPDDEASKSASDIASARAQFLNQVMGQLLDVAVFYQLKRRFSDAFPKIAAAALVVVAAAAVYAWASSKPTAAQPPPKHTPAWDARQTDCVTYYLELDRLADDDPPPAQRPRPALFSLDPQAIACGFKSEAQLTRFVAYLSSR